MQKKTIIEIVRDKRRDHVVDQHIVEVTGKQYHPRPHYFRHKETGEEYYAVAGGLAFPERPAPGFGVIVGVVKDDTDQPILKTLDEFEERDLVTLLATAEQRRHRWGYPHALLSYHGDPERFLEAIYAFNEELNAGKDAPADFYLDQPSDFGDPRRTEIYLEQLYGMLRQDPNGTKRLFLGQCKLLRAHLQNIPVGATIEDHPAVAAIAYATHSLVAMRPWLVFRQPEKTVPTDSDAWTEIYGSWEDQAPWDEEDDGGDQDGDGLVPTVD